MGQIKVGTSGFKYDDWKGCFYPDGLEEKDWLPFYAKQFDAVEINATFYSILTPRTFFFMARKVPNNFHFVIKAHRSFTHDLNADEAIHQQFTDQLKPLAEQGKLGCLLLQFPFSFHRTPENQDYLMRVCEALSDYPIVVEFRNVGWVNDQTFELLRDLNLGFCCVDEPKLKGLMPPVALATSEVGYIRFHGRNAEKWWQHEHAYERYDYLYSEQELREWLPKIEKLLSETETTYAFFNNHFQGKAATNAKLLMKMLGGEGG